MSILSVDNIQPIGSGTSVTVNSAATLVLNNANSTGVITATSFVGNLSGNISGDFSVDDKIIHAGDTDTAIRFPANDTFTVETAGSERLRITSTGAIGIGTDNPISGAA